MGRSPHGPHNTAETRETSILDANPRVETFLKVAEPVKRDDREEDSFDFTE